VRSVTFLVVLAQPAGGLSFPTAHLCSSRWTRFVHTCRLARVYTPCYDKRTPWGHVFQTFLFTTYNSFIYICLLFVLSLVFLFPCLSFHPVFIYFSMYFSCLFYVTVKLVSVTSPSQMFKMFENRVLRYGTVNCFCLCYFRPSRNLCACASRGHTPRCSLAPPCWAQES
jgi:hypothetical protein